MSKTVVVLGAKGRFGRHALKSFVDRGWTVRAFARNWGEAGKLVPRGVELIEGDAFDPASLTKAIEGVDVVAHGLNAPYNRWNTDQKAMNDALIRATTGRKVTILIPGNVYNYGEDMPSVLKPDTPHQAKGGKGKFRIAMEADFKALSQTGPQVIILRSGDFIDTQVGGNWLDTYMAKDLHKGDFMYPGKRDQIHAWAFLPDLTRAMAHLAEKREDLGGFVDLGFTGYSLTGNDLIAAFEAMNGQKLRVQTLPWAIIKIMAWFRPLMREVLEMRYLWDRPHVVDGSRFDALVPEFKVTPLASALQQAVENLPGAEKAQTRVLARA